MRTHQITGIVKAFMLALIITSVSAGVARTFKLPETNVTDVALVDGGDL